MSKKFKMWLDIYRGAGYLEEVIETAKLHHDERGFSTMTLYPEQIAGIKKLVLALRGMEVEDIQD